MSKEAILMMIQAVLKDYDDGDIDVRALAGVLRIVELNWSKLTGGKNE